MSDSRTRLAEVLRARVGNGHGGVLLEEHQRDRLSDQRATAEDERALSLRVTADVLEHSHAAARRARAKPFSAYYQEPGVERVQAVDILGGVDRIDDGLVVQMVRQGQLDEDAVDVVVAVELEDQR